MAVSSPEVLGYRMLRATATCPPGSGGGRARAYGLSMAAPVLAYESLGLVQGEGWLFRGLDLYIGERDRLALIGRNGAGKTTLLKCLAGLIETDEGKRTIVPGTKVVLLEQDPAWSGFATLRDWVLHGPDAPQPHEAAAIADQLGIDLDAAGRDRLAAASGAARRSRARWRNKPDVLLLDEPTNHLDLARSNGSRIGSSASPAPSSSSATTAPS
jgi:ATP-binding cassette subfamily F protein uup